MPRPGATDDAATVRAPRAGETICVAVTNSSSRFAVPDSIAGRWVRVTCDGDSCDMFFGDSAATCTYGKTSTVATEVITIHANTGDHLEDGVADSFIVPKDKTHFAACTSTGAAKIYIRPSS